MVTTNNFGFVEDNHASPNNFGFVGDDEMQSHANPSLLFRATGDLAAGLADAGQGAHNFLARAMTPILGKYAPAQTNIDFGKTFGVNDPNTLDKLAQGAAQYAPYMLGGEVAAIPKVLDSLPFVSKIPGVGNWMNRIITSNVNQAPTAAIFGATQSEDPIKGAVDSVEANTLGIPLHMGGSAILNGAKAVPSAIKNYLSKYAAQGLASNISADLNNAKNATNSQAFDLAKSNFSNYSNEEGNAWNKLSGLAQQADASGAKFNNQNYLNSLSDKLQTLQQQSGRQSGFARANQDAQSMLQDYMNDQHGSFTDAIEHNKALNQDYQNEITPGKSLPFNIVNYAKSNIKNSINDNIQNNSLSDDLGSAWSDANKATSLKNQLFNQVVNPGGNQQISTFSKLLKSDSAYQDPTTFVKDYVPTSRGDGTQKMQQFSQMLGDDNQAKNILKMNYFDHSFDDSKLGINPNSFINKYSNLSDAQKNYLFEPQQNQTIKSLSKILTGNSSALDKNDAGLLLKTTLGMAAGYGAGHMLGSPETGAIAGGAAIPAVKMGLSKLFENPSVSNYFSNYLSQPSQASAPSYLRTTLSSAFPRALPALSVPYFNQQGGQ